MSGEVRAVAKFVEKPDPATAASYVKAGYLWNSGNFMFRAAVLLDEYRKRRCGQRAGRDRCGGQGGTRSRIRQARAETAFGSAKAISIDYAVMEKTARAAVVPVACGWSDVGSWHAVWELSGQGRARATRRGALRCSRIPATATSRPTARWWRWKASTISWWSRPRTPCWCRRQKDANGLKRLVAKLKTVAPQVTEDHIKVHRPWGSYQSVDNGDRHQVKRIIVKPGGRLSLQKHHHRAEHWIVVRGTAQVTVNELVKTVHENESIYIPIGAVHRLENPGKIQLELIEVQTGSYFGEDDIIRIEDDYQRT